MYKYDWSDVGAVKLITRGEVRVYKSIRDMCAKIGARFLREGLANRRVEHYVVYTQHVQFVGGSNLYMQEWLRNGIGYVLIDMNDLIIPQSVIDAHISVVPEKVKKRRYDPDKDFRNGPLRWYRFCENSRRHHSGYTEKKNRGYRAELIQMSLVETDEDYVEHNIGHRTRRADVWHDDLCSTRRGQSWKRYRKNQWKERP